MSVEKIYRALLSRAALRNEVAEAKQQFSFKPFLVEYRPLKNLARAARWLLAAFSVATGFGFLFGGLSTALPVWAAAPIAGGLLLFVEVLKNIFTGAAFRQWYGAASFPLVALPAVAVFALSVYFSMQGVQSIYRASDKTAELLAAEHAARADSLKAHYTASIEGAKQELVAFKASVSWKGKINLYNQTTARALERYGAEIERLTIEQQAALARASAEHQQAMAEAVANSGFNLRFWVWLSVGVELAIMGCLWFLVYYAFRVSKEADLLASGEQYTVNLSDLRSLAETVLDYGQRLPLPVAEAEKSGQIGFRAGGANEGASKPPETGKRGGLNEGLNGVQGANAQAEKERELRAFLAKYKHVVQEIERGASNRETVQNCGVSLSTVHNVKRCLRALEH